MAALRVQEAAELHFKALKRVHCPQLQWMQASQGLASKLGAKLGGVDAGGIGVGVGPSVSPAWSQWGAGLPEGLGAGVNHKGLASLVEFSSSLSQYLTASLSSWSTRLRQAAGPVED